MVAQAQARVEELRAFKARALGLPNARLEAWDRHFYAAQLKARACHLVPQPCSRQSAQCARWDCPVPPSWMPPSWRDALLRSA